MQPPNVMHPTGERERRWYPRRVIVATLIVALVVAGFYLLYLFSNAFFVLFVAIVLATAIRPAVLWLERYRIPQWLGVLLIYALLGLVTVGLLALIAPLLVAQVTQLTMDLPRYYEQVRIELATTRLPILRSFANQLPGQVALEPQASGEQMSIVGQFVSYMRAAGWATFGGVAIALIAFFWIVDRERLVRAILLAVPIDRRDGAMEVYDTLEEKVGAFMRGQALLCLSIGLLSTGAFLAIGVPNALLLGVLAGVLEAVPYIGPIATAVLAVGLTLAQAPDKIWWVIGACVVIQQIENAVLVPRIMGRTVGVNAVVTLLAIAAFGTLLGLGGAIMAIPLAVILQVIVDRLLLRTEQQPTIEIEGRDHVAVLRYQAQSLAHDLRERIRSQDSDTEEDLIEEELEAVVGEIDELLAELNTPAPAVADARPV